MATSQKRFPVPSGVVAKVQIIDTKSRIDMLPTEALLTPTIKSLKYLPTLPAWSFLVENPSGRRILFDLSIPTDWQQLAPTVSDRLTTNGWQISAPTGVDHILKDNNIPLDSIESIVWSHWHWDHIGNPERFPSTTDLIVGPGFQEGLLPAYPQNEKSSMRESDFKDRKLREITFQESASLQLGQLRALDYFGDGSFYLLDTPGHAIGHLAGLARTTSNPDTFIFMGGDLTHHACEIRPSPYLPIPREIPASILKRGACPGEVFESVLEKRSLSRNEPFSKPVIANSLEEAVRSIQKAQDADADDNILYLMAHDSTAIDVIELFPKTANDWKKKGWRDQLLWAFLKDLEGEVEA